ncbi:MAG: biotin/lipoate--protein ligase family protein [Hyphomicrobiales bacterium]
MTPQFPPLLTSHELKVGQSPARKAAAGALKGKYGAGDVLWLRDNDTLDYAVVLEPEVDRTKALDMIFVQMVALGDAIGAIGPPELAITHHWPNKILANGAEIGSVRAILSEEDDVDGYPRFMVISTHINVRPTADNIDPGLDQSRTTLWDEGCGDLDAMMVLDSTARHFMSWMHTWDEEGFQPVLTQLDGRMVQGHALSITDIDGTFLGLDESANLLLKHDGGTQLVAVTDGLDTTIMAHVE